MERQGPSRAKTALRKYKKNTLPSIRAYYYNYSRAVCVTLVEQWTKIENLDKHA